MKPLNKKASLTITHEAHVLDKPSQLLQRCDLEVERIKIITPSTNRQKADIHSNFSAPHLSSLYSTSYPSTDYLNYTHAFT